MVWRTPSPQRDSCHWRDSNTRTLCIRGHALVHVAYRMAQGACGSAGIVQLVCCPLHLLAMFDGIAQRRVHVQRQVFVHLPLDIRWQMGLARVCAHLA